MLPETVAWKDGAVILLDQRDLPLGVRLLECRSVEEVAQAIETLAVRGAPAIGIAAAYGMALAARLGENLLATKERLARTRPTAVNLFWALDRMWRIASLGGGADKLLAEAHAIQREDVAANEALGEFGAQFLPESGAVLTHCNAGAIATGGFGTALGIVRAARRKGKDIRVFADETRPVLQGARLTAWELSQDGIPVTVLCDGAASFLMARNRIDAVIVGADRIAANGDTANKIGTYGVALAAQHHGVPFFVAAPSSTLDRSLPSGESIPIEERNGDEVRFIRSERILPEEIAVWNPAFDVTPAKLITAIITEKGVAKPPFVETIAAFF